jgi:agmatine/peptidylarginine deiminase
MPIQWGYRQYTQFIYKPDYLDGKDQKFRTDTNKVLPKVKESFDVLNKSPLKIDGGNIVFCSGGARPHFTDYVVMTDKVIKANPDYDKREIEHLIQKALMREGHSNSSLKIIWLPWAKGDLYGHTDGILHYVGISESGKPIVLVNLEVYEEEDANEMYRILSKHFEVIELKLSHYDELSWAYINMLQTRDVILVPGIGDEVSDTKALKQIKSLFPQYEDRVYQIQMKDFIVGRKEGDGGGALNCCTWTISREMSAIARTTQNVARYESLVKKAKTDEMSLSDDEIRFLGDYNPLGLERLSTFLDKCYWGF